jgi:putative selenium metabolism protein SsnA
MSILLKNLCCAILSPSQIESVDLRIKNGKIVERGKKLQVKSGEDIYDLAGKIVLPGFVCAHTHLYSALSRGMPGPKTSPQNFMDILQSIWWKLDRALDDDAIYYSALVGAIDAVRCGTTTLVDHHASPRAIAGSLDVIKEGMEEIGIRGVLCYEVTDRGGTKERDRGLKESERFIRSYRKNASFRGLVGAHASFTLSDTSLRLCGEMAEEYDTGAHVHVAEDLADTLDAANEYERSVIDRLDRASCLRKNSILAHGVHLSQHEIDHVRQRGSWIVHNPRSNMNNSVGYAPVSHFGNRSALGTDGFPADMFEEAKIGFYKMKDAKTEPFNIVAKVHAGQQMVSELFGEKFGTLAKGSVADLVVLDYVPPTPLAAENLAGHFLFGMQSSMVESVMIAGKWVLKNRVVVGVDLPSLYEKARKAAQKLWRRMETID